MEFTNELSERTMMAIEGFLVENNLINESNIKLINDEDGGGNYEFLDKIFGYYNMNYLDKSDFGTFAISNGYINESDEEEINIYVTKYLYKLYNYDYDNWCNMVPDFTEKLNYYSSIFVTPNRFMIAEICNHIYNRDNIVVLK